MHNSQFLCFLTEEMRYQDLVMRKASMVRSSFCSAPSRNWSVSAYTVISTVKKKLCAIDGHSVNTVDEHVHLIL